MDYSEMSTLLTCPRKWKYMYVDRKSDDSNSPATKFGSLWHLIQETGHAEGAIEQMGWVDPTDDYRTADKAIMGFKRWHEQYEPWEETGIKEEPFSVHLIPELGEPYEGRMDRIVKADAGEGRGMEKWVVDFKTASSLPSDWIALYRVSNQFKLYFTVARLVDPEVVGVMVDVFHVTKGNKSGKSEGEKLGVRFYRVFFRYTPEDVAEAVRDFAAAVKLKQFYFREGYFPRNTKSCRDFNRACAFLDVCETSDENLRKRILNVLPENTFDPLRRSA